jgi:hypothetical protein
MSDFNPDKVKRGINDGTGDEFVLAKDYDKLLALWKAQWEVLSSITGDIRAVALALSKRKP